MWKITELKVWTDRCAVEVNDGEQCRFTAVWPLGWRYASEDGWIFGKSGMRIGGGGADGGSGGVGGGGALQAVGREGLKGFFYRLGRLRWGGGWGGGSSIDCFLCQRRLEGASCRHLDEPPVIPDPRPLPVRKTQHDWMRAAPHWDGRWPD